MSQWSISAVGGSGAQGAGMAIPGIQLGPGLTGTSGADFEYATGLVLRITPANGGTIISIRADSPMTMSPSAPDVYVIAEGQDLGAEIGKIITMHYLKRESK